MPTFNSAVFAAGPYSAVYNSVALGLMRGDQQSPVCEIMRHSQLITDTHLYARTPIGAVGQGGEAFASLVMMEAITGALAVLWPYASTGKVPTVGIDDYNSLAQALVLTNAGGNLAAANPTSVTMSKAVIAEDFPLRYIYGPILRELPLRFRLYPDNYTDMRFWVVA